MCKFCGTANYRKIYENHYGAIGTDENGRTLDVHHIDGDHENNAPENLKALCQRCHNAYDAKHRAETRKNTKLLKNKQNTLNL